MKSMTVFMVMLFWVAVALLVGYQLGTKQVEKDIASFASFYIDQHRANLKTRIVEYDDIDTYGWTAAEAKFRNQSIGEMKAYERILREVTQP